MSIVFPVLIALLFIIPGACLVAGFIRVYQAQSSPQNRITNVIGASVTFGIALNSLLFGFLLILQR